MLISGYTFCVNAREFASSHSLSLLLSLSVYFYFSSALSAIRCLNKTNNNSNSNNSASGDIVPSGVDWQRVACGVCGMWQVVVGCWPVIFLIFNTFASFRLDYPFAASMCV